MLAFATAGAGCADEGLGNGASTCYPGIPVVTPASAPAGSVVSVSGPGFGDCDLARYEQYELRMYAMPEYGIDERGRPLGPVSVHLPTGIFTTPVPIPADAAPGERYVGYSRHPRDHAEHGCDDGGSCGRPAPNLTIVPGP